MTTAARIFIGISCFALLLAYGGAGDQARVCFGLAIAVILLLLAIGLKSHQRLPPMRWMLVLFIPLIIIPAVQIIPFGWHHPWVTDDLALLNASANQWSIDPGATGDALYWTLILGGLTFAATLLWRGERLSQLVQGLILAASASAVLGFLLVLTGSEWPSAHVTNRVRGPFIYTNHAAAFWTAILPLALLMAHRERQKPFLTRWWSVAVIALAILLSGSRGGILVAACICIPLAFTLFPAHRRWRWALGITAGIASWLWFIGIQDVVSRFEQLQGEQGVTLNGRMTIWNFAWPTIQDAGALGSGGGSVIAAYRRSGDTVFNQATFVNHLHSDPLEWWLEYGWIGIMVLSVVLFLMCYFAWRTVPTNHLQLCLRRGAALGLGALGLHACGDFIWHNTAVTCVGLLLILVLMLAGGDHQQQKAQSTRWLRLTALLLAIALGVGAWPNFVYERARVIARDAQRHLATRATSNLPLTHGAAIDALRTSSTDSIRVATYQAWLARSEKRFADAELILQRAAQLSPGDAATWMERALLAAERGDQTMMRTAIIRALHWAPTWVDVQQTALFLAAGYGQAALPPEDIRAIIQSLLQQDRPQPPWFFAFAAHVLGTEKLEQELAVVKPALARSSERWAASQASLQSWLSLRKRLGTTVPQSAWLAPVAPLLYGEQWKLQLPAGAEARRLLADGLLQAGLSVPTDLSAMISTDGPLYRQWTQPFDVINPQTHESLSVLLRSELHRTWAKQWADRLTMVTRANTGDTTAISRDSDPTIIAWVAGLHPTIATPMTVSSEERQRCALLLRRWNEWDWIVINEQVRWSWYFGSEQIGAPITVDTWTAIIIDGAFFGWIRGTTNVRPLIGQGLHRVVLISP